MRMVARVVGLLTLAAGCSAPDGEVPPEVPPPTFARRLEGYRPCRGPGRDVEKTFCDATALWGAGLTFDGEGGKEVVVGVLSAADFDGDGRVDLVAGIDSRRPMELLLNRGERFEAAGERWGLGELRSVAATATADLDGDGDPDLLVLLRETQGTQLLRNEGDRFVPAGRIEGGEDASAISLSDLDADGRLDVVVASASRRGDCALPFISGCPEGVLAWRQSAPWEFAPVPVHAAPRRSLALRWYDLDNDGVDELLVANDFGMLNGGNQVLRVVREGGAVALRESDLPDFREEIFAMGIAPIDVDANGADELIVTNYGRNLLLRREGDRWVDDAMARGAGAYGVELPGMVPEFVSLDPSHAWMGPMASFRDRYLDTGSRHMPSTKWTPLVFDYDQDGREDVYIGTGMAGLSALFPEPLLQAGVLLRGDGRRLVDVTDAMRLAEVHGAHFPVAADLDNDGDLDLAMIHGAVGGRRGALAILRNDASGGGALTVRARGRGGARDGVGARVRVRVGPRVVERRLDGNLSIAGSGPHELHIGLGGAAGVDELQVRFVSGVVRRLERVPAGAVLVEE